MHRLNSYLAKGCIAAGQSSPCEVCEFLLEYKERRHYVVIVMRTRIDNHIPSSGRLSIRLQAHAARSRRPVCKWSMFIVRVYPWPPSDLRLPLMGLVALRGPSALHLRGFARICFEVSLHSAARPSAMLWEKFTVGDDLARLLLERWRDGGVWRVVGRWPAYSSSSTSTPGLGTGQPLLWMM